jgi:hypothetical protein
MMDFNQHHKVLIQEAREEEGREFFSCLGVLCALAVQK